MPSSQLREYPWWVRLLLSTIALALLLFTFKVMTALSQPTEYLNSYAAVQKKPGNAKQVQTMGILDYRTFLYLVGPIVAAENEKNNGPLFRSDIPPAMNPATFSDATGAIEIQAHTLPLTPHDPSSYSFNQTLHFLGWRISETALELFAVAASQAELSDLLYSRSEHWKRTLFAQGALLAILVFSIFWLLNLAVLSNPSLQAVQLLLVNLIFLVLFYSVLVLVRYPLASTVLITAGILAAANLVFFPLSWLVNRLTRGK
ncbi:MAG: hypothetical protein AB1439_09820 [candidate division FCPU426 bacterium]